MMILAMIQRLVISNRRGKIDIDTYRRIIPSLNILREKTAAIKAEFSIYMCIAHKKHFYNSTIYLDKVKENGIGVNNISTFQIKKRPSRRNRAIINDDKIPKLNVSLLCKELEYCFNFTTL